MALGDDAADSGQWEDAVKWFTKAQEFAEKLPSTPKRQRLQAAIQDKLDTCRYNFAYSLQAAGKDAEAIALAKEMIAKLDPRGEVAPKVGALWVRAALHGYATAHEAPAKEAALAELAAATKLVVDNWPDKPEADDARIALGQASLVQGKPAEALAGVRAGQPTFAALSAGPVGRGANAPAADGSGADTNRTPIRKRSPRNWRPPGNNWKRASSCKGRTADRSGRRGAGAGDAAVAGPGLFDRSASRPKRLNFCSRSSTRSKTPLRPSSIRPRVKAFSTAVKAYAAAGQLAAAGGVADLLLERGQDDPQVNAVLVTFARTLASRIQAGQRRDDRSPGLDPICRSGWRPSRG